MAIYETTFAEKIGTTDEQINVKIEYCVDQDGDGDNDIKITLALAPSSNSATEDMIGVAFDIQNDLLSDLQITNILRMTTAGTLSTFVPTVTIGANNVSDGPGYLDPGFNTSGGNTQEPYDIGIQFSKEGSGEGIVQSASFVISSKTNQDLNAEALLENTDWWIRLQSTDGGAGSAKTGGQLLDLPSCDGGGPSGDPGRAQTPGFYKNADPTKYWPTAYKTIDSFNTTFGVSVTLAAATQNLLGALGARGGGVNALARAGTAALLNAAWDAQGSGINYVIDQTALASTVVEVGTSLATVLNTLDLIDTDNNNVIGVSEVKAAVYDALTVGGSFNGAGGINLVATAFDAMNNYVHLDKSEFPIV